MFWAEGVGIGYNMRFWWFVGYRPVFFGQELICQGIRIGQV